MSINQMLLPEFDMEMANTRKMLEALPDGNYDYKPHEKSMTLGRLAGHVAEMPNWAIYTLSQDKLDLSPDMKPGVATSRSQILEFFDKQVGPAREALSKVTDEQLMAPWTLSMNGKEVFTMPRIAVLRNMVLNHMVHHRAQLGVYLRLNNQKIPGMYGPSADEKA